MQQISVIARQTFKEAVRNKILFVFIILGLTTICCSVFMPVVGDGREKIKIVESMCFRSITFFGTLAAILLSASSIPTDIENGVLSTVTTKPVQRTTIILGKIIGFIYIIGVVLIVMGGVSYALIKFTALKQSPQGNSELVAREQFDPDTLQITGESARKSTGSYYTPRAIVNYMVDESLLLYLKDKTGISEEKLKVIISYDLNDDVEKPITAEEKGEIIDALEKVKILDPACGSGAFPIGALQKIVFILQQADPDGQLWFKKQIMNTTPEVRRVIEREFEHKNFDYIRKSGIIRENIYGIDIQPIATEISRLRCFLTLIVDERIQDESENRGIEPLPNLDFKFVTANSLIGLPKIDLSQQTMFDDYQKIDELKQIRDQYFNAYGIEREQLKTEFSDKQNELINELIAKHDYVGYTKAELTRNLTNWKPFKHSSTEWFDPEWMFGLKDGFDIVIANPPYVGEKGHRAMFERLRQTSLGKRFSKGKMDLFYYFFLRIRKQRAFCKFCDAIGADMAAARTYFYNIYYRTASFF